MMRIGGLATGMDTESIIKNMMEANRLPLTKVTQKKQQLEWQLDNYRSINLSLGTFSENTRKNMIMSDTFRQKTMDISSPGALGVKNHNSTGDFSGTIKVGQLATNSTMQGEKINPSNGATVTTESTLEKLGFVAAGGTTTITVNAIGADGNMPVEAKELTFKSTDTLQSVLNKINKETGVTAFYDSQSGQIGVATKNGGTLGAGNSEIVIEGTLADNLGLSGAEVGSDSKGQNAIFEFNGMEMMRSSNTFQINGFEFTLKDTTGAIDEATGKIDGAAITFASAPDVDSIVDNVVKFVDEYNKLIESLNDTIREPKYRDFHPLSAEEKADMKEKEIELWEEKAMSGTLRNDPMISSMLSQMRTALMGAVGDQKNGPTLKSIGITTSSNYLDNGKLVIDEKALREAINEDPDKVHKLFSDDSAIAKDTKNPLEAKQRSEEMGFARRLREIVQDAEKKITNRAGSTNMTNDNFTLGKNLIDMDKQITRFEDRLKMVENRLWKQFTAMEVAIQKANAQSASLMNAFGGA